MRKKRDFSIWSIMMVVSLLLAACTPETVIETVTVKEIVSEEVIKTVEVEVEVEKEVVKTEIVEKVIEVVLTPQPTTRNGAWVDMMIFTSIDEAPNAVAQLRAGALDLYAYSVQDPDAFVTVKNDLGLDYSMSYGFWDSLLFNPSGPTFQDGRLNPFSNPKIREAVNWLIDREYLVQEAVGGLGSPKVVPLISAFPDYALYADLIRPLENKYAFNFEKAKEVITAEMDAMGAVKDATGKWAFNGGPVVIIGLIRSEDEREYIGNYFASQLEAIGFSVDRQVRTRNELAPLWQQSDPTEGQWHYYTGGNYYPGLVRNQANAFADTYTNLTAFTTTEEAFDPTPEFLEIATQLYNNEYASMEERRELFAQALPLALENSQYVQVLGTTSFFPRNSDLIVGSDLSSGVGGSQIWPYTIRWTDQEGGTVRSAQSGVLTGPWNPVAGMNWIQEQMLIRASNDDAVMSDPYTGLSWPLRAERGEIQVLQGTPINQSLDWVTVEFVDEIEVPSDAWLDWDAVSQKFITVGEKFPEGLTTRSKNTIYYPADIWNIKWHDGSSLSMGDFVNYMIFQFDNCKPESAIYDQSVVSTCEAFLGHFKGVKIVSTDPLVIETYDDLVDTDAENQFAYYTIKWWPTSNTGPMPWHTYVVGMLAEANQELAFTADKSSALGVDWTNYIDGPSLAILNKYLDQAIAENYIPYAPTLGQYISTEEAATRYKNLNDWYVRKGHFWVGSGLFYLEQVNSVEGSVVMQRNLDYPDPSNRWDRFGEPMIAVVDVSGPGQVMVGLEAVFDVFVTFDDQPYLQEYIDRVSYLLYDTTGELVSSGACDAVVDGQYQAILTAEITKLLSSGTGKVEIVVAPVVVGIPTIASTDFIVVAP